MRNTVSEMRKVYSNSIKDYEKNDERPDIYYFTNVYYIKYEYVLYLT